MYPRGQVACWGSFLELFTEWGGNRAGLCQAGELWDDMGSSLQDKEYLGSNLCPGQASKSEFKLHPYLPKGCSVWMIDQLGSWMGAQELSLQRMPPCSQTSLIESGLMVPLLSSALVSSIEHPGTVAVMCDGSGGSRGACLCQSGV